MMKNLLLFLFSASLLLGKPEDVVILGSGPAGLTAAIYTARAGLSPLVIEGNEPGGQIAYSEMVENFPGFPEGISGYQLSENMRTQATRFGAKIASAKVVEVDLSSRPFSLFLEDKTVIQAKSLIIASGASAKWLGLPSEQLLVGKGVSSCATCDGYFFKNKHVVVVGGGDTAMEDALLLTNYAQKVTVIHRRDSLRASKVLQDKAFANKKIEFIWNSAVEEISDPEKGKVTGVSLRNLSSGKTHFFPCDGVFVAIGHTPNTALFAQNLPLDELGYIILKGKTTATSIPGLFAAGDITDPRYRQAVSAAGSGCMAAIDAYRFLEGE